MGRRGGGGRRRSRLTGSGLRDRCLRYRFRDRRRRRLRARDTCRSEHDAQFGRLDASLAPWKAEAGQPESLALEGQRQQQRVNQQGEQQRNGESPVFAVHASIQPGGSYTLPPFDSRTASGRVAGNSENTIVRIAVIGTARNAPGMPQSSAQTARLMRMANGLRFSELPIT